MPRLAPDGTRCKENRMTFGTAERKMIAVALKEQQKNRTQKYVSSFALPISAVALAAGIGVAGYFVGMKILDANPLQTLSNFKDDVVGKYVTGEVRDPVTNEMKPFEVESVTEGNPPITNPTAGIPVVGSLFALGMRFGEWGVGKSTIFNQE